MIQTRYNQMWQQFKLASLANIYELDPFLLDPVCDTRRGITALAYLNQVNSMTLNEMSKFQSRIQEIEPDQYFHPLNELHLTILSIVSCTPGFQLSDIDVEQYIKIYKSATTNIAPIEIEYRGVTASANCIVLQGFPVNNALEQLRHRLRAKFQKSGLRVTFDCRYKLVTAHSSLVRFRIPITNSEKIFNLCQEYRTHIFGRTKMTEIDLVFNNWYQQRSVTKSLAHETLKSGNK